MSVVMAAEVKRVSTTSSDTKRLSTASSDAKRLSTASSDTKRVRFRMNGTESAPGDEDFDEDGQWEFLKYLLTLREEFNVNSVVDSLVQKGIISADAGTDIFQQGNTRAQIELCVTEVMKGGPPAYVVLCETLTEHGYSNIVEALGGDALVPELSDLSGSGARSKEPRHWSQSSSVVQHSDDLSVKGKKMSIKDLSRDAKTSQKEFHVIVERQQELEKQLSQVLKSLDTAKDMLIRERQEKLGLREQLKDRDSDLVDMQRKYLELQKAMGILRETNNKYHEKVTKLQIENEQLRKTAKDKKNLEVELDEKNKELGQLKETLKRQEHQLMHQEENIINKLDMIEKVVNEHKGLVDGQDKLNTQIAKQSTEIIRLSEDKADSQNQIIAQQRQLNFQQAQITMLHEHMQRIETQMTGVSPYNLDNHTPHPNTPANDNRGGRYLSNISKGLNLRPFNASGKAENSKNTHWRSDVQTKKYK